MNFCVQKTLCNQNMTTGNSLEKLLHSLKLALDLAFNLNENVLKLLSVTDPWVSITTGRTLVPVFFIVKFSYKVLILANLLRFFCSNPRVDG